MVARTIALCLALLLAGCSSEGGPAIEVAGGGFIFNYRIAEVTAGVVVVPLKPFPEGSSVEMTFENPAGGAPIVVAKKATPETPRIDLTTPPLTGVRDDRDYQVTVRLLDSGGKELEKVDKNFRSQVDQAKMPSAPLTVGPGYTRNPQAQ
jgi:hypothetical protein